MLSFFLLARIVHPQSALWSPWQPQLQGGGARLCRGGTWCVQWAVPQQVFRNQLHRKNDFYSYEMPSEDPLPETRWLLYFQINSGAHLCRICSCLSSNTSNHEVHYSSKKHQTGDRDITGLHADDLDNTIPNHNFPLVDIIMETKGEISEKKKMNQKL